MGIIQRLVLKFADAAWRRVIFAAIGSGFVAACFVAAGGVPTAASASAAPSPQARFLPAGGGRIAGFTGAARYRLERDGLDSRAAAGNRESVALGGLAGVPGADLKTKTVYVPVSSGHVVDVINAARCNAHVRSGCRVVAKVRVGSGPLYAVVDQRTDTIYVLNGNDGTVSVLNGARCNGTATRGCRSRPVATVKVGDLPVAAALDRATRTLYVANVFGGSISVIDAGRCNATTSRGCRLVRTVKDRAGPDGVDVDQATDTVYVANSGTQNQNDTVSVINGAACNGSTGRGCRRAPHTITVGGAPFWVAVDQGSNTVYVANNNDGTVSVINGARCNGRVTTGCRRIPPVVFTGGNPQFVAVDPALHTVFALNNADDTLSEINTRTCNGRTTSGCRRVPPSEYATFNPPGGGNPNSFALVPATGTLYLANAGGAGIVSVVSISRCNATDTRGCRKLARSVPDHEFILTLDPVTHTIYAGNDNLPVIDVINAATCKAGHLAGCTPVASIPVPHPQANLGSVDDATHTLYSSDPLGTTVAVINTATCNATDTAGCSGAPPTITIGASPGPPELNPVTHSLYVPFSDNSNNFNQVAVINSADCNAMTMTGCTQPQGLVTVEPGTFAITVDPATNTVYAPGSGTPASEYSDGRLVAVINGATCNGTTHAGCGNLAATAKVGHIPFEAAVDDQTHTMYVSNDAHGELPGTVSVINTATCNGTVTTGCSGPFPTMATGRLPLTLAIDTRTSIVYVADGFAAAVSMLNGSHCRAGDTSGCAATSRQQDVGSIPQDILINPATNTVYATQDFGPRGDIAIFRTLP